MDKLEELKSQLKSLLDETQDTELIKKYSSMNDTITSVESEQKALADKNVELAKAYKDAILHGGFNSKPVEDVGGTKPLDFDTMLKEFISNSKENK